MLEPLTHIDPVYVCCVLALLSYLPGINVLDRESFSNLNIVFLVFITGCMAIGFVGGSVGANKWAVASIVPLLQGWGETMSVVCAYAAGVVINFLLTPLAATAAFTPAFGELGTTRSRCSTHSTLAWTSTSSRMKPFTSSTFSSLNGSCSATS